MSSGPRAGAGRPRKDGLPLGSPRPPRDYREERRRRAAAKAEALGSEPGQDEVKAYSEHGQKTEDAPKQWPFGTEVPRETSPEEIDPLTGLPVGEKLTVLQLLERVAMNPKADHRLRLQAATYAAPYLHAKVGEAKPKKPKESAPSKYVAGAPPLRIVG